MVIYKHENERTHPIIRRNARLIRGRFLVKARKLGVLVMTFIALAAILRASGVDDFVDAEVQLRLVDLEDFLELCNQFIELFL